MNLNELHNIYSKIKKEISEKLEGFYHIRDYGSDNEFFSELAFCIFTPQSKASMACIAVKNLTDNNLMFSGFPEEISPFLNIVRFKNNKARYLVHNRSVCSRDGSIALRKILDEIPSIIEKREWLKDNILGFGYKEASHFLRNTGYGGDIAILDRHILRNLGEFGVIKTDKISLSEKKYIEIEEKMREFSREIGIPMDYLDFVMWYKEAGEIIK